MKFLIVDDDPAILKITEKLLQLQNYEVHCCDNALDAIQTLGDLSYDIMITDATMPAYSGFDLIRTVKKTPELNYLTIAMLTGRSEKSDIEQAVNLGVQDYIIKPIDPEIFIDKIEKLAQAHQNKKLQKPKNIKPNAQMSVPIHITRVTDIGLTIESPYPLNKGTIVTIDLEELKQAGISQNRFKAIFNTDIMRGTKVLTELLLLDISPTEQNQLINISKKWMRSEVS